MTRERGLGVQRIGLFHSSGIVSAMAVVKSNRIRFLPAGVIYHEFTSLVDQAGRCGGGKEGKIMEPKRKNPTREEEDWCRSFEQDLRKVEKAGVPIFLDGKREDLRTIAEACMIRENGPYWCQCRSDENGLKLCFLKEESV